MIRVFEKNQLIENYSNAFYQLHKEDDSVQGLETAIKELETIEEILENDVVSAFMHYPKLSKEEKIRIFRENFHTQISKITLNFVLLLIDNNRIDYLVSIINQIKVNYRKWKNIILVEVKFGFNPDEAQIEKVKADLTNKLNSEIELYYEVDQTLIGGLEIHYQGKIIDNTIKSKINRYIGQIVGK